MGVSIIRGPKDIVSINTGAKLKLSGFVLGSHPSAIYSYETGEEIELNPSTIEKSFYYPKPSMPSECVVQGKYECAAASLATLLGHSLFQVKRVMGSHGWRNDRSGAGDYVIRETARAFGRDLIYCGRQCILEMLDKVPSCMVTVPSLNYTGASHAVSWYQGQIIDPNYNRVGRKFYGPEWAPWTIGASSISVVTKNVISDFERQEIKIMRDNRKWEEACSAILSLAG